MEDNVVFDVKQSSLDVIIPGVAVNGLAFEDKKEAEKFLKKYFTNKQLHLEERVEKPVYSSLAEFEQSLQVKLEGLKKQLSAIEVLEAKLQDKRFQFDKAHIEYYIKCIEQFLGNANESSSDSEDEREGMI